MIKQYRKKPVVIEAVKFVYSKKGIEELATFCGPYLLKTNKMRHLGAIGEAHIGTLEDGNIMQVDHIASEGDYIIKGVAGEFYACKESIFLMTYEEIIE
jgi:hypothetical protein